MKELDFNGVKIKIVSKSQFAKIIGASIARLERMISKGVLPLPTFVDKENPVNNWKGEQVPRKYYLYQEAIAIRTLMKKYVFGQGKPAPEEFIEEAHAVFEKYREALNEGGAVLMDYPLVLEFKNIKDLKKYLKQYGGIPHPEELAAQIYKDGNKLLEEK